MWPFSYASPANGRVWRAWTIVLLLFFTLMLGQGTRAGFGAVVEPWQQDFDGSRTLISLIGSLNLLFYAGGQPVVGWLVNRLGGRNVLTGGMIFLSLAIGATPWMESAAMVMLTYGIAGGLGFAFVGQISAAVIATRWFQEGRGTVLGIIQSGASMGRLTMVPLMLILIAGIGWERTFTLLALVMGLLLAPLLFLVVTHEGESLGTASGRSVKDPAPRKPAGNHPSAAKPEQAGVTADGQPAGLPGRVFWHQASYWALIGSFFICGFTTGGLFSTHIIPFALERGYSQGVTALALALLGLLDFLGTLAAGTLADRLNRRHMLQFFYLVRACTYLGFFFMAINPGIPSSPWLLVFLAGLFGLFDFATLPVTTSLTVDIATPRMFPIAVSWVSFSHQLGAAAGAFVPGLLYDRTGSYAPAFASAVVLLLLAAMVCQWIRLGQALPNTGRGKPIAASVPK